MVRGAANAGKTVVQLPLLRSPTCMPTIFTAAKNEESSISHLLLLLPLHIGGRATAHAELLEQRLQVVAVGAIFAWSKVHHAGITYRRDPHAACTAPRRLQAGTALLKACPARDEVSHVAQVSKLHVKKLFRVR
jgi:hypothetical protein